MTNQNLAGMRIDHVLLTRFNLPSGGAESLIRAEEGWLRDRVALFERYTVPSVRWQTAADVRWIVYFDPESPDWLVDRLSRYVDEGTFVALYRESVSWRDVVADAHAISAGDGGVLVTTNVDNDDALAVDFAQRVQEVARTGFRGAIYLERGLIQRDRQIYLRRDPDNAFCSVAEPWTGAMTAWRDWHVLLHHHMPTTTVSGAPGWLQVVHGRNVSNRIRGRLIDGEVYASLFPGMLADLPVPSLAALSADRYLHRPMREARELVRRLVKNVVLGVGGKGGLERLSQMLAASRRRLRGPDDPTR